MFDEFPTYKLAEVSVDESLLLKVFQSFELRYPSVSLSDLYMLIFGVVVGFVTTIGAVPLIDVTVPPREGSVLVIVHGPGCDPETDIPVPESTASVRASSATNKRRPISDLQ